MESGPPCVANHGHGERSILYLDGMADSAGFVSSLASVLQCARLHRPADSRGPYRFTVEGWRGARPVELASVVPLVPFAQDGEA